MNNIKEFKNMFGDLEFKYIFSQERFLKDLINSYFEFIGDNTRFAFSCIKAQDYIAPNKRHLKGYFADVSATLTNGEIIILEAFTNFNENSFAKSYSYLTRMYSNQIKQSEKEYKKRKKVTCLNFIDVNYKRKNNDIVNSYIPKNKKDNYILGTGEIENVLIRFDLARKICYDEYEPRFITWLKVMGAGSEEEMIKNAKGDKNMEESIKFLKWYSTSEENHTFEDIVSFARMNAKEEGITEGEASGEYKNKLETARNMLQDKLDIKSIIKYTGLTKKEIKAIAKNINN